MFFLFFVVFFVVVCLFVCFCFFGFVVVVVVVLLLCFVHQLKVFHTYASSISFLSRVSVSCFSYKCYIL